MEVIKTGIEGLLIIQPKVFHDGRGYFFESFNAREFLDKTGIRIRFVQDNESLSTYGVMRGLHYQRMPHTQAKLVHCVRGRIVDIALDLRHGSPTFGKWEALELSEDNHRQLFIPRGFAHGFAVLSETAVMHYKCDNLYEPSSEAGIDLGSIGFGWPFPLEDAILSEKDRHFPSLEEAPIDFQI